MEQKLQETERVSERVLYPAAVPELRKILYFCKYLAVAEVLQCEPAKNL